MESVGQLNSNIVSKQELQNCRDCQLWKTRTNALTGEGNLNSYLMFVAQAPGEEEDKADKMFVGPSGKIFRKLLTDAGIDIKKNYMTNLIKCNIPQNRRPKQREIKACSQYLLREIEYVNPAIIVNLGYYATKFFFEKYQLGSFARKQFSEIISQIYAIDNRKIYPISHPAAILYHKEFLDKAKDDYRKIAEMLPNSIN
mgnify:CR=1 FL=1